MGKDYPKFSLLIRRILEGRASFETKFLFPATPVNPHVGLLVDDSLTGDATPACEPIGACSPVYAGLRLFVFRKSEQETTLVLGTR